jgi:hypothetical protein
MATPSPGLSGDFISTDDATGVRMRIDCHMSPGGTSDIM